MNQMNNLNDFDTTVAEFKELYPEFDNTEILNELRSSDYSSLDKQHHVYLDYTGGGLYADRQIEEHSAMLRNNIFGNPHLLNPASVAMTQNVEQARVYS